jgi:putative flippase GtrA
METEKDIRVTILTFICVGVCVAIFQYVTFYVFFEKLDRSYIFSSSVSFVLTVFVSYVLQKYVTFYRRSHEQSHKKKLIAFLLFFLNALFGLILNGLIMFAGVEVYALSAYITQMVSMVILATYNFFIYRLLLA